MNDLNLLVLVQVGHWAQVERWTWPMFAGGTGVVFVKYDDGRTGWPIEDVPWKLQRILDDLQNQGYTTRQIGDFVNVKRVQLLN